MSGLAYTQDWEAAKSAYAGWWQHRAEKPLLAVSAWETTCPPHWSHWDFLRRQGEEEKVLDAFARSCEATSFFGDAFPSLMPHTGPIGLAPLYTGHLIFQSETAWVECRNTPEEILRLSLDTEGKWYRFTRNLVEVSLRRGEGKWITAMPDFSSPTDILAALRGTQNLLEDFADRPDTVAEMTEKVTEDLSATLDAFGQLLLAGQEGMSSWMRLWCPSQYVVLQCDFSTMISSEMFDRLCLPYVAHLARTFPFSVYHLDGPGAVRHLPSLLDIAQLDAIQWTPGAGNPGLEDPCWMPLYRQVLSAGKNLVLLGVPFASADGLLRSLGTPRLFVSSVAPSVEEGRRFVAHWKKRPDAWHRTAF